MENFKMLIEKYGLDEQGFSVEGIGKIKDVKTAEPQKGFVPFQLPAIFNKRPDEVVGLFEKDPDDETEDPFAEFSTGLPNLFGKSELPF